MTHSENYPSPPHRLLLSRFAHDHYGSLLERPGVQLVVFESDGSLRLPDGTEAADADAEIAFASYDLFLEDGSGRPFLGLVSRAPSLRWFQSMSAGYDGTFFASLADRGVRVTTTHANGVSIAEYVIRAVLDHLQRAQLWRDAQSEHRWTTHEFREVAGTTWLIVGLGSIGGGVARLAKAFGSTVVGCRRRPDPSDPVDRSITPDELLAVVPEADVVVLSAPSSEDTRHLVDERFLDLMKEGSVLVNVARGSLVDETALLAALDRGRPEAAILDVFATEPLPADHPFWAHPAVTVTPHNTAFGTGRGLRQAERFATNLDRFLNSEPLHDDVTDLARVRA